MKDVVLQMRESLYNQPFCRVKKWSINGKYQWYFGYNTLKKKFIAYSDTSGTTSSAKIIDSLEELRSLMRWYLDHEWETDRTWPENIMKYASE